MPGKRKPIAERRSHPFQIRLTEAEFSALDARAESEGVNLADMIRSALGLPTAATMREASLDNDVVRAITGKRK